MLSKMTCVRIKIHVLLHPGQRRCTNCFSVFETRTEKENLEHPRLVQKLSTHSRIAYNINAKTLQWNSRNQLE